MGRDKQVPDLGEVGIEVTGVERDRYIEIGYGFLGLSLNHSLPLSKYDPIRARRLTLNR
jgi:hypothetical protein